ncbi:MAG: hypothetical protein ACYDG2_20760 [Ruminiclostridium sp.]
MAEYTLNYNLEKQQSNEYISIEGLNNNFDSIDTQMKINGDVTATAQETADNTTAMLSLHQSETASETTKGHVELATAAETTTGTDSTKAVHPAGLKVELLKKINHSLATAANDFLVSPTAGVFIKRTLAEVKDIIGVSALGTAAYTASTAYATAAQGLLAQNALPKAIFDYYGAIMSASSFTLALGYANKVIIMTNGASQTITIPTTATADLAVGTQITVIQQSYGTVTFVPAADNVSLLSKDSKRTIDGQYASATLIKTNTNNWVLIGALV